MLKDQGSVAAHVLADLGVDEQTVREVLAELRKPAEKRDSEPEVS